MTAEVESVFKCGHLELSPCQAVERLLLLSPAPDPADPVALSKPPEVGGGVRSSLGCSLNPIPSTEGGLGAARVV